MVGVGVGHFISDSTTLVNTRMPHGVKITPVSLVARIFSPACFQGKSFRDFSSFLGPNSLLACRPFMSTLNMIFLVFTSNARRSNFDYLYRSAYKYFANYR